MAAALGCSGVGSQSIHFFGLSHLYGEVDHRIDNALVYNKLKDGKCQDVRHQVDT